MAKYNKILCNAHYYSVKWNHYYIPCYTCISDNVER